MTQDIWAVIPIKERTGAKQRLSRFLPPEQRQELAAVMIGEVLDALAGSTRLAGVLVVTLDPLATQLAERIGARVVTEGARDGHTGAVLAGRAVLLRERRGGLLTLPGDIPCVTAAEIDAVLAAHRPAPSFTIVPAHDAQGSNTVVCSPPDSVPLRFGDNSYFPHLDAARAAGIAPTVVTLPGIGMDVDHPVDLARLLRLPQSAGTRTRAYLESTGVPALLAAQGLV